MRQWSANMLKVALEAIMLQVSYSFFNQLGPSKTSLLATSQYCIIMGLLQIHGSLSVLLHA
jgi:hypothetical protein